MIYNLIKFTAWSQFLPFNYFYFQFQKIVYNLFNASFIMASTGNEGSSLMILETTF